MVDQTRFLEIADKAVAHLERLMHYYPHQVSSHVKSAVENWEDRTQSRGSIEMALVDLKMAEDEALSATAAELLESHQMEDVMEMLAEQFSMEVDYARLIALVGKGCYTSALRREVNELKMNSISFDQMANLWNSMGKPSLGGDRWTAQSISMLAE
ncbi:MAG: hypothetical protein ABFR65_13990 [Pseudomonadota bacterium]